MNQFPFPFSDTQDCAEAARALSHRAPDGHFDELLAGDGQLRTPWLQFFRALGPEGLNGLPDLEARLSRRIAEDGVTYNVYADARTQSRRWSLDLLPFLVSPADWRLIEPALRQRARLLAAILGDIYGPQRLLHEGLIPPALVHGNPAYQRTMANVEPLGGFLSIIAFDLARGPDGQWWVLGHRSQAPSGLGYALENRIIIGRLFGNAFSDLKVQRLAASCQRFLRSVMRRADEDGADGPPRVILLTPGRYSETFFEQSYLAHYLGIPLVEGRDLTVRNSRVYLKTLRGLERVHAIIRRTDDAYCDPLELNPDSALGVPGLLQAVRARQVLLANAIGSAVIESPALQGFLPAASEAMLGETLLLPPRDSWWCGEPAAREHAFSQLREVRVRGTYRGSRPAPPGAEGEGLLDLARLRSLIQADPDAYTIQSYLPYSKTPCWSPKGILPRSAVVRFYAFAEGGDAWHVIPGGLTRIAERQDEVSMQRGGSSADAWVVTGEAPDTFSLLKRADAAALVGQHRVVSSRAAENLFWLGRYTERLENSVRLAQLLLSSDQGDDPGAVSCIEALARCAESLGIAKREGAVDIPVPARRALRELQNAVFLPMGDSKAHSLQFAMDGLVNCADQIRERLSLEHWQQVSQAGECMAALGVPESAQPAESRAPDFAPLLLNLAAITAAQTDGMTRDDGWQLLSVGRQIERLQNLAAMLCAHLESGAVDGDAGFDQVLSLFRSSMTYRSRYPGQRHLDLLLDLLVTEAENPRSLAGAVHDIREALSALDSATGASLMNDAAMPAIPRALAAWIDRYATMTITERCAAVSARARDLALAAHRLSDRIEAEFFSHTQDAGRQVSSS